MMQTGNKKGRPSADPDPPSGGEMSSATKANGDRPKHSPRRPSLGWLSFSRIGVIYVWIVIIIIFSFAAPDTFPTWATVKSILNQNAIAGLIALALVVPLSARTFDLSVGSATGLCNMLVAWLLVNHGF